MLSLPCSAALAVCALCPAPAGQQANAGLAGSIQPITVFTVLRSLFPLPHPTK